MLVVTEKILFFGGDLLVTKITQKKNGNGMFVSSVTNSLLALNESIEKFSWPVL